MFQEKRSIMPERILINSDLLIKVLKAITSAELQGRLIILRPLKLLHHWELEIRQRLKTLEKRWDEIDAVKVKELEEELIEKAKVRLAAGAKASDSDVSCAAGGTSEAIINGACEPAKASNCLENGDLSDEASKENITVKSPFSP